MPFILKGVKTLVVQILYSVNIMETVTRNISESLEGISNKFFGKYRGIVVDNNDPENLGRLKVTIPSLLGNDVVTGWAMPCVPYGGTANCGFVAIPDVDAGVWIEFEEGDLEFPVWVGTYWSKPGGTTEIPEPANEQGPPTSKIFKSNKHVIELADEDDNELIKIVENERNEILINDSGIVITDTNENVITLDDSGILISDKNSNEIKMESGFVKIKSNKIVLDSSINLIGGDGASEPLVLGNQLMTYLAMHTHPSAMGPTGPPIQPALAISLCSMNNKTQ